ncbi:MAG: chalcone isomerase family protein, partial [Casimicrobiaceae bacterium]
MRATFMLVVLMLFAPLAGALEVSGVVFPDSAALSPEGPQLVLNGAGERKILVFRIYAIGLYLPVRAKSLGDALALKGPKRIHMVMLRDGITSKQVHDHVIAQIEDGTQPAEMAVLKEKIDELTRIIEAEHVINLGGTIFLDYVPGTGTVIRVNGAPKGEPIPGEEFFNSLLRIW